MIPTTTETSTIYQSIEQVDKTVIDKLLTDIAAVPDGHYWLLDEGDALYTPPTDILFVPASTVRDPERDRQTCEECLLADIYDLNGRRIPLSERPEGWFDQQAEIRKPGPSWPAPNAVHRLGDDYLIIGRGIWHLLRETTIDGQRGFEVADSDALLSRELERRQRERRTILDANPIIEESKPFWATDIYVSEDEEGDSPDVVCVEFTYGISVDLFLSQPATVKDGKITLGEVVVQDGHTTIHRISYAVLASDLRGFADVLARLAEEAN